MQETLRTDRLILRPFRATDAGAVTEYCGDWDVARMTARLPHPYPPRMAAEWIAGQETDTVEQRFCVEADGAPVGAVGLSDLGDGAFEIGYWIGRPFWGRGYATEAALRVVRYAFEERGARRLTAAHFLDNPASARVLEKCGFAATGETVEQACVARGGPQPSRRLAFDRPAVLPIEGAPAS
ncbi:MAG: GNAT family N-acetyltransferase [Inquilinus sp.]|nr:GNAT family N-acetyltransferase [Inquilinus sp.]